MKISLRLTIALLVAAIVPLLIVGIWNLVQSERALADLGEEAILLSAESVARQVELYLAAHPELNQADAAELQADAGLAEIAVQLVGQTGYTALFDEKGVTHFHSNPGLIGVDLGTLADQLPEFWAILSASLDGSPADGYYDWEDADGRIRPKYMSIVAVEDTPFRIAATTYIDEFSQPADKFRLQLLLVLVIVALAAVAGAWFLGRWFSQPIHQMIDTARQITDGKLGAKPPSTQVGEFNLLASAFGQMTSSLSSLIRKVRAMSLSLSSAAGQVMMTQRLHAANSDEQAAAVTSSSTAVEELASSSAHIAETAQQVVVAANNTQSSVQQGVEAMADTVERLDHIAASNQASVAKVRVLGEVARQIGGVMDLIEDIAAQTKMIAFNASIEASAAGEAGRRFAVVAGEVRQLAGSVAQSTEEIRSKVEQIQTTTNELIIASERESKEIESGLAISDTMAGLLDQILGSAQETSLAVQQISLSTQQQRSATEHLLGDLRSLTAGATTVAAGSQQTVAVMENLVTMAQDLQLAVDHFSLPEDPTGPATAE